jgi:hypothetical protein
MWRRVDNNHPMLKFLNGFVRLVWCCIQGQVSPLMTRESIQTTPLLISIDQGNVRFTRKASHGQYQVDGNGAFADATFLRNNGYYHFDTF